MTPPYGRKQRRTKKPLDKSERGEWKSWLKLNIQKTKIMASGPITSWEIDGGRVETVSDFIFWGSKITADGDCSHEFKRCLLLGRKTKTNLDSVLESRDITLLTKVCIVKAVIFPVVMYRCESWTRKKAELLENWCFWTMVLEKTLESPLDSKEIKPVNPKGNQPWLFIRRTDAEAEAPILWLPEVKSWLTGKEPEAGKYGGQEEKGTAEDEMVGWHQRLNGWVWVNSGSWWWTGRPGVLRFMGSQRVRHNWATELNFLEEKLWSM